MSGVQALSDAELATALNIGESALSSNHTVEKIQKNRKDRNRETKTHANSSVFDAKSRPDMCMDVMASRQCKAIAANARPMQGRRHSVSQTRGRYVCVYVNATGNITTTQEE